jgi:hypothetical protein
LGGIHEFLKSVTLKTFWNILSSKKYWANLPSAAEERVKLANTKCFEIIPPVRFIKVLFIKSLKKDKTLNCRRGY